MNEKEINITKDFASMIAVLVQAMGYHDILDINYSVEEMRNDMIGIKYQDGNDIRFAPLDFNKRIPEYLNKESLVLAKEFESIAYYQPKEAGSLFHHYAMAILRQ